MKWLIASDIHGSAFYCRQLVERCKEEGADRMLLLGDVLYHGPRNDLPREYAPKQVVSLLNAMKDDIICVRGNCDCEVDQMVLDFPIMADYAVLDMGKYLIYATHGHIYNEDRLPPLHRGDVLLLGHTHIQKCQEQDGRICMNPGSVSIPKGDGFCGYMTLENGLFLWKDIEGKVRSEFRRR